MKMLDYLFEYIISISLIFTIIIFIKVQFWEYLVAKNLNMLTPWCIYFNIIECIIGVFKVVYIADKKSQIASCHSYLTDCFYDIYNHDLPVTLLSLFKLPHLINCLYHDSSCNAMHYTCSKWYISRWMSPDKTGVKPTLYVLNVCYAYYFFFLPFWSIKWP